LLLPRSSCWPSSKVIVSRTVAIPRQGSHEVVAASPNTGVDTVSGEGFREAMAGAFVLARSSQTSLRRPQPVGSFGWAVHRFVPAMSRRRPNPSFGLNPMRVGERVVDVIRTKTFDAFVSAVPADVIKARHRRIEEALNSPWVTHC
jgi:hypothetical protein